jgi:osmotically-inducible protein OsmY
VNGVRAFGKQVRAALASSKSVNAANTSLRARSGAVTLYRTVPDNAQTGKAADIARSVAGVMQVNNRLTLQRTFVQ